MSRSMAYRYQGILNKFSLPQISHRVALPNSVSPLHMYRSEEVSNSDDIEKETRLGPGPLLQPSPQPNAAPHDHRLYTLQV
jgi:hypothetical protein